MTSLEERYRRLLRWYPKEHRALHEEEMITVLLAGAAPGQNRPAARDAFDLIRGGLSIRLHRAVKPESRLHWRDAVNLAALLAPISLLLIEINRAAEYVLRRHPDLEAALHTLVLALPYGLVVLLAWLKRPTAAAVCAWGWAVLHTWLIIGSPDSGPPIRGDGGILVMLPWKLMFLTDDLWLVALYVLPAFLCAAMLTFAPSPSPAPLGSARLLGWTAAVFTALVALTQLPASWGMIVWGDDRPHVVLVVAVMIVALYFPVGRRAVIVLLPLLSMQFPWLILMQREWGPSTSATLSAAVLAVTAWLARTGHATSTPVGDRR